MSQSCSKYIYIYILYDHKIHAYHIKLLYFCEDVNVTFQLVIFLNFLNRHRSYYPIPIFFPFPKKCWFCMFFYSDRARYSLRGAERTSGKKTLKQSFCRESKTRCQKKRSQKNGNGPLRKKTLNKKG